MSLHLFNLPSSGRVRMVILISISIIINAIIHHSVDVWPELFDLGQPFPIEVMIIILMMMAVKTIIMLIIMMTELGNGNGVSSPM